MCSIPGRLLCSQFLCFSEVLSEVPSECLFKPSSEGMNSVPSCASQGDGSSSCCSPVSCSSDLEKVGKSPRRHWKSVSNCFRKADGWNCWLSAGRQSAKSIRRRRRQRQDHEIQRRVDRAHQKISGQSHRKTVCQESRGGHCPVPGRPVDKGGL